MNKKLVLSKIDEEKKYFKSDCLTDQAMRKVLEECKEVILNNNSFKEVKRILLGREHDAFNKAWEIEDPYLKEYTHAISGAYMYVQDYILADLA